MFHVLMHVNLIREKLVYVNQIFTRNFPNYFTVWVNKVTDQFTFLKQNNEYFTRIEHEHYKQINKSGSTNLKDNLCTTCVSLFTFKDKPIRI